MEKRIIPIIFGNDKLRLIISEIVESRKNFGNLDLRLANKNDLHKNKKSILITDSEFVAKESSHVIKFDSIFIINCNGETIEMDKFNSRIIVISIPMQIRDLFQQVSISLDQIDHKLLEN